MAQPIQDIIDKGKISTYLCANDTALGAMYSPRLDPNLYRLIYIEMKSLEWANQQSGTYTNIEFVGNYNIALYGAYGVKAKVILDGGGGGSIVPVSPVTAPSPIEFIVSGSSFIPTGGTTKIITSFIGYNLLFIRNNVTQGQINNGASYFNWDRTTGVFTLLTGAAPPDDNPAAVATEFFQLYPYL